MENEKVKVWQLQDRDLKKGDIIRCKVGNKENPHFGQYCYAICSGEGFGCSLSTMGNAIFISNQSFDLDEVLASRNKETKMDDRWERFWGIEYLIEADKNTIGVWTWMGITHDELNAMIEKNNGHCVKCGKETNNAYTLCQGHRSAFTRWKNALEVERLAKERGVTNFKGQLKCGKKEDD